MKPDSINKYLVAGLCVGSELELPELEPCTEASAEAVVNITIGKVPERLPAAAQTASEAEIAPEQVLLTIPNVGRYLVQQGRRIFVEPAAGAKLEDLRLFLLGSAFGALYFQRGYFPLHASVVVVNGRAVAFTGDSGAGKSTMAAWMHAHGHPLLCDDVCVIRFNDDGAALAYPGFPRLKLWKDALNAFDMTSDGLQQDYSRADKYHVQVSERFWIEPVPLQHINILQFTDTPAPPRILDVNPAHAVHLLRNNTYRYQYISGLGLTRKHFLDCVKLARSVRVHTLLRPHDHAALDACGALVEAQLA